MGFFKFVQIIAQFSIDLRNDFHRDTQFNYIFCGNSMRRFRFTYVPDAFLMAKESLNNIERNTSATVNAAFRRRLSAL